MGSAQAQQARCVVGSAIAAARASEEIGPHIRVTIASEQMRPEQVETQHRLPHRSSGCSRPANGNGGSGRHVDSLRIHEPIQQNHARDLYRILRLAFYFDLFVRGNL